ncbi:MAG: hypothetical protein QXZ48_00755 [Zestosphaera sp.]
METNDAGTDEKRPEANETKSQQQATSANMKLEPPTHRDLIQEVLVGNEKK